ncbi:MAG: DUF131 domain-containing protein [Thaumarchaeota archaeon]|nr:DUF131 domain-containing protein [Nitrososphaerota archaeon]
MLTPAMNAIMITVGLALILLGAVFIMLAFLSSRMTVKGGGVILIGPFPIIFGDQALRPILLLFAVLAAFLFLIFAILSGW